MCATSYKQWLYFQTTIPFSLAETDVDIKNNKQFILKNEIWTSILMNLFLTNRTFPPQMYC